MNSQEYFQPEVVTIPLLPLNEYLKGVWGVPKELCSENEGSLYFARITMFLSLGIH